jgi:hypothetical protein
MSGELSHTGRALDLLGTELRQVRQERDAARAEVAALKARAEGYAMVRLHGCGPFVVSEKELKAEQEADRG